jgi:hypothetical protein
VRPPFTCGQGYRRPTRKFLQFGLRFGSPPLAPLARSASSLSSPATALSVSFTSRRRHYRPPKSLSCWALMSQIRSIAPSGAGQERRRRACARLRRGGVRGEPPSAVTACGGSRGPAAPGDRLRRITWTGCAGRPPVADQVSRLRRGPPAADHVHRLWRGSRRRRVHVIGRKPVHLHSRRVHLLAPEARSPARPKAVHLHP